MANYSDNADEVKAVLGLIDTYKRWANYETRNDRKYFKYHPSEWGKAQPLDAEIQTPYGPKKMKDIKVGDEVCGVNGDINIVTMIHPQGVKDIYEVNFADGDKVECCGEHLWEVDSKYLGYASPKIIETKDLKNNFLSKNGEHRIFSIRVPKPLFLKNSFFNVISPYLMGVLLGDGCLRCHSVDFTSIDGHIVDKIATNIDKDYEVKSWKNNVQHRIKKNGCKGGGINIYKNELKKYNLYGLHSDERFIPNEYLYAKEKDRKNLLHGLMDTDGTIDIRGYSRFSTKSKKMSIQFKWLIESLGGICIIRDKFSKCNGKIFHSYRCDIKFNNSKDLFSLPRKVKRGIDRQSDVNRIISDIKIIGKKECQCITIDNPDGLYLTNNCIVTHNCLREQQYKHYVQQGYLSVEPSEFDSKLLRLFDKGHNMHNRWSNYFKDIGVLRGRWKCKNLLCRLFDDDGKELDHNTQSISITCKKNNSRIYGGDEQKGIFEPKVCVCGCEDFEYMETSVRDDKLNMSGHADVILDCSNLDVNKFKGVMSTFNSDFLPKDGETAVGDMKTIGQSGWDFQLQKKGPHKYYVIQLLIYMHILDCNYGLLMYENKNNSELRWYKIERNDKWWEIVKWQAKQMIEMAKDKKLPPPRYNSKSNYSCKNCSFKTLCHKSGIWKDSNLNNKMKNFYRELL